jgi:uncharacterized membrane protein YdjX (TVP38/TMEM64 family)
VRRLVALSVVLVALFAVFWIVRPISERDVRDAVDPLGAAAAPAFVVLAGLLGAALVPGPLLAGASGLLFGTLTGFFVTLAAAVLTALIGCAIGARAARNSPVRDTAMATTVREHGTVSVIVQRLLPVVPDGPFNYAFGVAGVSAWPLALGTLIGSSPRAFAYTALGDSVDDGATPLALVAIGVVIATGALGTLIAVRMRRAG